MRLASVLFALCALLARGATKVPETIRQINAAAAVFDEVNADPDSGIPRDILDKARCIAIVASLKHADFILGAKYGKGVVACRDKDISSGWAGPSFFRIENGSVGFQFGAGETDLVLVLMNQSAMNKLLDDKFELNAESGVAAGPVGRSAPAPNAEILSYSRAHGNFDGVALTGITLRPADELNAVYYGHDAAAREILTGAIAPPHTAGVLTSTLDKYIPSAKKSRGSRR